MKGFLLEMLYLQSKFSAGVLISSTSSPINSNRTFKRSKYTYHSCWLFEPLQKPSSCFSIENHRGRGDSEKRANSPDAKLRTRGFSLARACEARKHGLSLLSI